MAKKRWMRRNVGIGAFIVALSIGIAFASLSYLQHPTSNSPHGSIQTPFTRTVRPGNESHPGVFDVRIPNVTISENFYIGITVTGGGANLCALNYTTYFAWKFAYNFTHPDGQTPGNTFPWTSCLAQATQVSGQYILQFPVTPGTWAVVALNTSPDTLTVTFSPA